jgi:hypothetical protein
MVYAFFPTCFVSFRPLEVGYRATKVFESGWMEYFGGQGLYWVPFNLGRVNQLFKYRVIKKSLCTWWLQYKDKQKYFISQNTFGMWTVLYWTRSSRTQFGVSINVWRVAGDTLNITCNFLHCNHQVHRDFLITLYNNLKLFWGFFMWVVALA